MSKQVLNNWETWSSHRSKLNANFTELYDNKLEAWSNISVLTNDSGYLTSSTANTWLATKTTDNLTEGSTNKYATASEKTKLAYISVTQAVDLDTIESDTATNNAKVTNATHTGEVTGATALTVNSTAISNKTAKTTLAGTEEFLINDGWTLKKVTASNLGAWGEVNTASNVWTWGVGVFKQKSWVDLQFKKINAGSNKVTITDDTWNNEVDIDVAPANFTGIPESAVTNLVSDLSGKQPLNSNLTTISGLSPTNDDIIQRKAGAWTNRTMSQLKTDLALTKSDVGLWSVVNADTTTTANITDSTNKRFITDAQQTVLTNTSGTNTGDQTITLTGAVTGSGTGSFATTLASWIDATKIADGTVTSTEFQYINSLTSNAQNQINGKLANVVEDTSPTLWGDLDLDGNDITSALSTALNVTGNYTVTTTGTTTITPSGTGYLNIYGTSAWATLWSAWVTEIYGSEIFQWSPTGNVTHSEYASGLITHTAQGDTNIDINFVPAWTGHLQSGGNNVLTTASNYNLGVQYKDEGSNLGTSGTVDTIDFTGSWVTASRVWSTLTVNVTWGGGGGGTGDFSSNTSTSVDSEIVLFSGTGGKTGKRATGTGIAKITSGVLWTATAGTDYLSPTWTENVASKTLDNTNTITLKDTLFTLQDDGDTTKQLRFQLSGITTATTRTMTVPDVNGTLITTWDTGTVTNTMLAWSISNAKLSNSAITIAGTSTSLWGTITQDTITGLWSTGIIKRTAANTLATATAGTDYENALTFSTGLTRSTNTITVNTTQNIAKLSNLTSNWFVKTSAGDGTLSVDTSTYLTGNQTITLSWDVTGSGATSISTTVWKINWVSLAGLATWILKNTTTTGVPSIAVAWDFPTLNQSTTWSAATLTTARAIYGNNFDGSASLTQIIASTYGGTGNGFTKFSWPATTEIIFTGVAGTLTAYSSNANGTTQTKNALASYTQGSAVEIHANASKIEFYVNGVLKNTHTTNIPSALSTWHIYWTNVTGSPATHTLKSGKVRVRRF